MCDHDHDHDGNDGFTLCVHCFFGTAASGVELLADDVDAFLCEACWARVVAADVLDLGGFLVVCARCAALTIDDYRRKDWRRLVWTDGRFVER
jgi:hypothetical protein